MKNNAGGSLSCPLCLSAGTNLFCVRTDAGQNPRTYFKCPVCYLVFLSPEGRLEAADEKKHYDFHQNHLQDANYLKFLNRLAEPLIERLSTGACGLDFGCGPGPTMSFLFEQKGFEMKNYDPVYRPEAALLTGPYDFITCSEAAEHFHTPRREFSLLDRLLKKGALLGIMSCFLEDESAFQSWWYAKDPTHISFYQKKTLEWIAAWKNWKVESILPNVVIYKK